MGCSWPITHLCRRLLPASCPCSGPVGEILPFFEQHLGFECPVRKDKGSFLQEVTTPVGQYAYATPALLAKRGLTEAARDPLRLLTHPPKDMLTPVEEMEAAFYKGTQVGGGWCGRGWGRLHGARAVLTRALPTAETGVERERAAASKTPMHRCAPQSLMRSHHSLMLASCPPICNKQWGQKLLEDLDQRPFKPEDGPPGSLFTTPYANSMWRLTKLVGGRGAGCYCTTVGCFLPPRFLPCCA